MPRGICERDWAHKNPYRTRAEFNTYFKNLPTTKRKVCWIGFNCDCCPLNIASQDYDQWAQALVVYALTNFGPILTVFLASSQVSETHMTIDLFRVCIPERVSQDVRFIESPYSPHSTCLHCRALAPLFFASLCLSYVLFGIAPLRLLFSTLLEPQAHWTSALLTQAHPTPLAFSGRLTQHQQTSVCINFLTANDMYRQ